MHNPTAKNPFSPHANFFKHPGRGLVVHVAHGPDPVNLRLSQCPVDDGLQGVAGVASVPEGPGDDVACVCLEVMNAQSDGTDERLIM